MIAIFNFILILISSLTFISATLSRPQVTIQSKNYFRTSRVFGNYLYASVWGNNQLHQYDIRNGEFVRSFPLSHVAPITDIKVKGDFIFTASDDSTVKSWSISQMKRLKTYDGHSSPISALELSPNGRYMYSASTKDKYVIVWDTEEGKLADRISVTDTVTDILASADSRKLHIITTKPANDDDPKVTVMEVDLVSKKIRKTSFKGGIIDQSPSAFYGNGGDIYMLVTLYRSDVGTFMNYVVQFNLDKFKPIAEFTPFLRGELTDIKSFSLGRLGVYMMAWSGKLWRVNFDFTHLTLEKDFNGSIDSIYQSTGGLRLWVSNRNELRSYAI